MKMKVTKKAERMPGMWVSLKENINCRNKLSDVVCPPLKLYKQINQQNSNSKEFQHKFGVHIASDAMLNIVSPMQIAPPTCFKELDIGDPSRNVVEKILGAALINPEKKMLKINTVFKVKNSQRVVEKFENYRGMVKQKAKDGEPKHPRSIVDGNELLCYYVTTITCHQRNLKWALGPCEDLKCNVCKAIGFSMKTDYVDMFGIELSISSGALREKIATILKRKNEKRAVIVCRIIAGRTSNMENKMSEDEYDSIKKSGFYPNSEYLIVNNSNAVLPCFVVILN